MSEYDAAIAIVATILGVVAGAGAVALGFTIGYRAGQKSGELTAVKEHQRRRHRYRRYVPSTSLSSTESSELSTGY